MRRVVVMQSVSLDGRMAAPDGDLSWHRVDDELHRHFNDLLGAAGMFLEGRGTYELMDEFWPTADEEPDNPEPMREFAAIWRDTPKVVFSRTLPSVGRGAQLRREVDPDEVRAWLAGPGGDLFVGGADLVRTFRRHGLVDEYRLYVHPVVLGAGPRMFADGDPARSSSSWRPGCSAPASCSSAAPARRWPPDPARSHLRLQVAPLGVRRRAGGATSPRLA